MIQSAQRLASLDSFRGFTIAAMLLVNNPGDWDRVYGPLLHAPWHGWTFTDLIFPFFLFICGVSMHFSLAAQANPPSRASLVLKLWKRAALIFLVGLFLSLFPKFDFSTVRIPGVLQRIAVCIALAAPIAVYFKWRGQLLAIIIALAVYTGAMLYAPAQDAQGNWVRGVLEPGRDFGSWIDRLLMDGHLWAKAKTWDPEGLFTSLAALATLLIGLITGHWLRLTAKPTIKVSAMVIAGIVLIVLGNIAHEHLMPINKPLWTTSYVLLTGGWGLIAFSAFYTLQDCLTHEAFKKRVDQLFMPFTYFGMNALFLFTLAGMVGRLLGTIRWHDGSKLISLKQYLYQPLTQLGLEPINSSLLFAILFDLVFLLIAWLMWRKRWFIKV